jgi:hypothetical protein
MRVRKGHFGPRDKESMFEQAIAKSVEIDDMKRCSHENDNSVSELIKTNLAKSNRVTELVERIDEAEDC